MIIIGLLVQLLAVIPSVVYGFFGMTFLISFVRDVFSGNGRAVSETMAVIMVACNRPRIPGDILSGARTLTANIVLEMGYATDVHRSAVLP